MSTLVVAGKPLAEWVNAPHGAFAKAVRQTLDPEWGVDIAVYDYKEYNVRVDYSYSGTGTAHYAVKARNQEEAKKLALEQFDDDGGSLDFWAAEIDDAYATVTP